MASLKDMEMRGTQTEDSTVASGTNSFESSLVGDRETSSTTVTCAASKTESASSSIIHSQDLVSEHLSPDTSVSSSGAVSEVPPSSKTKEEGSSQTNPPGNAPVQSNEEADVSGKTKATLTVV